MTLPVSAAFGWTACLFIAPSVILWMSYRVRRGYHPAVLISAIACTAVLAISSIAAIWLQVWGL